MGSTATRMATIVTGIAIITLLACSGNDGSTARPEDSAGSSAARVTPMTIATVAGATEFTPTPSPVPSPVPATAESGLEGAAPAPTSFPPPPTVSPEPAPPTPPSNGDATPVSTPTPQSTSTPVADTPSPATPTPTATPTPAPQRMAPSTGVVACDTVDLSGFTGDIDPFYTLCTTDSGMLVMASAEVPDDALIEMNRLITGMTARRTEVIGRLNYLGIAAAVIGVNQVTTDLPEYAFLKSNTLLDWDERRGLGATIEAPLVSGAEENLLGYPDNVYGAENIFVHEFAHTLFEYGLIAADGRSFSPLTALPTAYWPGGQQLLAKWLVVYSTSIASGHWGSTYAATNWTELWAVASQAWFGALNRPHEYQWDGTREGLTAFDPAVAEVFGDVYPDDWIAVAP